MKQVVPHLPGASVVLLGGATPVSLSCRIGMIICGAALATALMVRSATAQEPASVLGPATAPIHETIPAFLSTPADGYRREVPVLVIRYLPTADGVNLDTSKSPDYYSLNPVTLTTLRATIASFNQRVKFVLEQGSRFRAYRNPQAVPSLGYRVVDDITVFEQTPPGKVIGTSAGSSVYGRPRHRIHH